MKTYKNYEVKMPTYALSYLVYADDSGLEPQEKDAINRFMEQFYREAHSVSGSLVISPNMDEEYFAYYPAFGLGCNVVDTNILILI